MSLLLRLAYGPRHRVQSRLGRLENRPVRVEAERNIKSIFKDLMKCCLATLRALLPFCRTST